MSNRSQPSSRGRLTQQNSVFEAAPKRPQDGGSELAVFESLFENSYQFSLMSNRSQPSSRGRLAQQNSVFEAAPKRPRDGGSELAVFESLLENSYQFSLMSNRSQPSSRGRLTQQNSVFAAAPKRPQDGGSELAHKTEMLRKFYGVRAVARSKSGRHGVLPLRLKSTSPRGSPIAPGDAQRFCLSASALHLRRLN
jgi:hypothetical protein